MLGYIFPFDNIVPSLVLREYFDRSLFQANWDLPRSNKYILLNCKINIIKSQYYIFVLPVVLYSSFSLLAHSITVVHSQLWKSDAYISTKACCVYEIMRRYASLLPCAITVSEVTTKSISLGDESAMQKVFPWQHFNLIMNCPLLHFMCQRINMGLRADISYHKEIINMLKLILL